MVWIVTGIVVLLLVVAIYDLNQRSYAIKHNYPLIGHIRYWLEAVGPELRQYIVTDNNEERPFSRDQRRWIYTSSKRENNYFGFGTDNEMELTQNYLIIKHDAFPINEPVESDANFDPEYHLPCGKILGGYRQRKKAFRPESAVYVSGMSYGSISAPAVKALNEGCGLARCLQNTGEGGISQHHQNGGQLIWQIGTGYFGCCDSKGQFSFDLLDKNVKANPNVRAIEIKLSQGAKPGMGGILPLSKITPEIAEIRGISMMAPCHSPGSHTAFSDVDGLLDFVEAIADLTGLPVGIKSAVGDGVFWEDLAAQMERTGRAVDFITIDGGEGGTGAAPLVFSDHVALPFKIAFAKVYRTFARHGLHENVVFIGSGKLGLPENALMAFALGCDMIAVGREALLSIGCIQAQRCHTGRCPTGICTQNRWLVRGLDPALKSVRLANYLCTLRRELLRVSRVCGLQHPGLLSSENIEILNGHFGSSSINELFDYDHGFGVPSDSDKEAICEIMRCGEYLKGEVN